VATHPLTRILACCDYLVRVDDDFLVSKDIRVTDQLSAGISGERRGGAFRPSAPSVLLSWTMRDTIAADRQLGV
jgi:hypothetical protein